MNKARAISVTWGACGLLSAAGMVLPWVGLVVTEDQMGYSLAGVGFVFMATGAVWMFGVARLVGLGGGERVSVTRLPEAMCALVRVKGVERIVDGVLVALLLCVVIQGVSVGAIPSATLECRTNIRRGEIDYCVSAQEYSAAAAGVLQAFGGIGGLLCLYSSFLYRSLDRLRSQRKGLGEGASS